MFCAALFRYTKTASIQPDPVISRLRPDRHFGSISEHMNSLIDNYMAANPDKVFSDVFYWVYANHWSQTSFSVACLLLC